MLVPLRRTPRRRRRRRGASAAGRSLVGLAALTLGLAPDVATAIPWPDGSRVYVGYHGNPDEHRAIERDAEGMGGRRFALGSIYPGRQTTPCPSVPCIEDMDLLHSLEGGVSLLSILREGRLGISAPKLGTLDDDRACDTDDADPGAAGREGCHGRWGWDGAWRDVIDGRYDGWIQEQRREILTELPPGARVIITFHPEPIREGRASLFRRAYAHVYRVFNTDPHGAWDPVRRVRWMWTFAGETSFEPDTLYYYREHDAERCPDQDPSAAAHHYCDDPDNGRPMADAYFPLGARDPSDPCSPRCRPARVDYGAMDPFSHNCTSEGDQTFRDISAEGYAFFERMDVPFFIQETARGADASGLRQADWIDSPEGSADLYSTLKRWASEPEPLVRGFLWFDAGDGGNCDWNLSAAAVDRFGVFAGDEASFLTL